MSTITLNLADDVLAAVRRDAERFGTTAEERLEHLVADLTAPLSPTRREREQRLASFEALRRERVERNRAVPQPGFVDESRETIYPVEKLY